MSRYNNIARSLIIVSKANGWDPCQIEGKDYVNGEYPEDRPTKGDTAYLHGPLPNDPQGGDSNVGAPGPDTRGPQAVKHPGTGNPYAGKMEG